MFYLLATTSPLYTSPLYRSNELDLTVDVVVVTLHNKWLKIPEAAGTVALNGTKNIKISSRTMEYITIISQ